MQLALTGLGWHNHIKSSCQRCLANNDMLSAGSLVLTLEVNVTNNTKGKSPEKTVEFTPFYHGKPMLVPQFTNVSSKNVESWLVLRNAPDCQKIVLYV